ncbi:MAG: integrase [Planctomycetaceae bacterium]|nr:MAG: integrase [Planctomycetaceae bacterium]
MTSPLPTFIQRFFSHYLPLQRGLSSHSVWAYRDAIKLLLRFAAETLRKSVEALGVEDLSEHTVLAFLDHLEVVRLCSARTRNARLAAIRSLFAFIAREDPSWLPQSQKVRSIPLKRTEHNTAHYLHEKQIQELLDAPDLTSAAGLRDRALLLLLYNTGARVSEIVGLKLADLRLDGAGQVQLRGKGNKYRSCPLWPETVRALRAYLAQRLPKDPADQSLFLNARRLPIGRFGIRHLLSRYSSQTSAPASQPPVTPHTIRHTTAMHLLRAGNDIAMVSYWLGHADINTTHAYLEIDMDLKRRMLEKMDGPHARKKPAWHRPDILEWLEDLKSGPNYVQANRPKTASRAKVAP